MHRRARVISWMAAAVIVLLNLPAVAVSFSGGARAPASNAVRSFYKYHLAHNKDFTVRNVRLRKRWLTPELYRLLLKELNRQAEYSKTHPDEVPDFNGDPFT
ncbi:MAG: hypothetical protein WAV20_08795, partial [Blastocatellia bacterium]